MQVHHDERPVCAFPKWFRADRGECGIDSLAVACPPGKCQAEDLEGVQPALPKGLAFAEHPVVLIPGRQKIKSEGLTDLGRVVLLRTREDPLRGGGRHMEVDRDRRSEDDMP
jgi:hypothetical protein